MENETDAAAAEETGERHGPSFKYNSLGSLELPASSLRARSALEKHGGFHDTATEGTDTRELQAHRTERSGPEGSSPASSLEYRPVSCLLRVTGAMLLLDRFGLNRLASIQSHERPKAALVVVVPGVVVFARLPSSTCSPLD